ncbi:asparagine synthase-domain-containing protein [Hygrophoropsis aurantiaca]|uniref:Asparagine synthase-domain-containing protein n=1 Tax=Hygrophoropsis aurantiaca TaxID=72124 RepID=A0ACB8AQ71_9AGAM|nr:asparagine synthase-domain-containing protein [Hygrophoropsis aurantiaca]
MCGIFCSVQERCHNNPDFQNLAERLRIANAARGPDAQRSHRISLKTIGDDFGLDLDLFASELRLRGDAPVVQPHEQGGDVFCWNGEIFEGLEVSENENDGTKLFEAIRSLENPDAIPTLLGTIEGPYAFVFYHGASQRLYFARDPLGRRSILIHKPSESKSYFLLASVSVGEDPNYDMDELSTESIFCLDLKRLVQSNFVCSMFYIGTGQISRTVAEPTKVNSELLSNYPPPILSLDFGCLSEEVSNAVDQLIFQLDRSVMLRVRNIPIVSDQNGQARVAVLFSGGIDSTVLAFLAHRHIPVDEPIDLLNVAFENPRKINVQVNGNVAALPKRAKKQRLRGLAAGNGVLGSDQSSYMVPDRVTGLTEVEELRRLCPDRTWNFVEVNVPYEDSQAARSSVEAIMFPSCTNMDLSLAMALYFASKAEGRIRTTGVYHPYISPARVLLNGLGSDELLGGYGRHRTAFTHRSWQGLVEELQLELDHIPTRNLGRDDRIISSHGKETRHPFLSLAVVSFLGQLPVHCKLDPRLEVGIGDKTLLRLAARKVGLVEASERKKRAMQFGSHSARMEGGDAEKKGHFTIQGALSSNADR